MSGNQHLAVLRNSLKLCFGLEKAGMYVVYMWGGKKHVKTQIQSL